MSGVACFVLFIQILEEAIYMYSLWEWFVFTKSIGSVHFALLDFSVISKFIIKFNAHQICRDIPGFFVLSTVLGSPKYENGDGIFTRGQCYIHYICNYIGNDK